jgi:hypothetical protein
VLDSKDAAYADLRVWVDANADGVSQADELTSLKERGIASLALTAEKGTLNNNGNWVGLQSSYTGTDGSTHQLADVWFQTAQAAPAADLRSKVSSLAQAINGFGTADAAGAAPGTGSLSLDAAQPAAGAASHTLAGVERLAAALRQFDAQGASAGRVPALAAPAQAGGPPALPGMAGWLAASK